MKFKPYSFSKIDVFSQCQKKFEYTYILKPEIEEKSKFHLEKGNLAHLMLECDMKKVTCKWKPTDFKELTHDNLVDIKELVDNFTQKEFYQKFKQSKCNKYVEKWFELDSNLNIGSYNNKILHGKIDFMLVKDNVAHIVDWKTGGKNVESLKRFPKSNDQLELYAIWAIQKYDLKAVKVYFSFVEHNYNQEVMILKTQIPELKEKFLNKLNEIETTETFNKNLTKLCEWCDYYKICNPTQ